MKARTSRLEWQDHHMLLALMTAQRSQDPNTQVGACIVDDRNRILSLGYNGPPRGVYAIPWEREGKPQQTKYPYIVHAEVNAILNAPSKVEGGTIYVSLFPCHECMKVIIQSGIKRVIFLEDKYADGWESKISKSLAIQAGVSFSKHEWSENAYPSIQELVFTMSER